MTRAIFIYGGWEGHTPRECTDVFAAALTERGFAVSLHDRLEILDDGAALREYDLIVPAWTLGELCEAREGNLCDAVAAGVGLAGWHGGMGDAFRAATRYQHMVGGQFVAHPGGILSAFDVRIVDREHEITAGLAGFTMRDSERYYMHVDPGNHVLAVTDMPEGFDMPVAWTRRWGKGRVAYVSLGHRDKDFDIPEAKTLVLRSLLWAAR